MKASSEITFKLLYMVDIGTQPHLTIQIIVITTVDLLLHFSQSNNNIYLNYVITPHCLIVCLPVYAFHKNQ